MTSKTLKLTIKGSSLEIDVKAKRVFFWIENDGSGFHVSISKDELKEMLQ